MSVDFLYPVGLLPQFAYSPVCGVPQQEPVLAAQSTGNSDGERSGWPPASC